MAFAYPQTAASASQLQPVGQMYPTPYQGMFKKVHALQKAAIPAVNCL